MTIALKIKKIVSLILLLCFLFADVSNAKSRIEKVWIDKPMLIDLQNYPCSNVYCIDSVFEKSKLIYVQSSFYKAINLLLTYQNNSTIFSFYRNGFANIKMDKKYLPIKNHHYECNHIENTRNGWWVQDDCTPPSDADLINNDWNHHYYGILYTPLATDGTLGNMGQATTDFNFGFAGSYDNDANQTTAHRLYRVVSGNGFQPKIYTNSITPIQSGSNIIGNEYFVIPTSTSNIVPPCEDTYTTMPNIDTAGGVDASYALKVILDSIDYYANPPVAKWLTEKQLYQALARDSGARADDLVLRNFFDTKKLTLTGAIYDADRAIHRLFSPETMADSATFAQLMQEAQYANAQNQNGQAYEEYERLVNEWYFAVVQYGSRSLTATQRQELEALAKSCPLLNGSAVYKARTLWYSFEPWLQYEDLQLCNTIGSAAQRSASGQSSNPFDFVLESLEDSTAKNTSYAIPPRNEFTAVTYEAKQWQTNSNSMLQTSCTISPNPAQYQITIKYQLQAKQVGKIIIYDAVGSAVQSIDLPNFVETLTTTLNNISNGSYTYQYLVDGAVVHTDKLIVIN